MTKHEILDFVTKNSNAIIVALVENGMGRTKHGSMIGLVINLSVSIIERVRNLKNKGEKS